jgi:hypothetical protein
MAVTGSWLLSWLRGLSRTTMLAGLSIRSILGLAGADGAGNRAWPDAAALLDSLLAGMIARLGWTSSPGTERGCARARGGFAARSSGRCAVPIRRASWDHAAAVEQLLLSIDHDLVAGVYAAGDNYLRAFGDVYFYRLSDDIVTLAVARASPSTAPCATRSRSG